MKKVTIKSDDDTNDKLAEGVSHIGWKNDEINVILDSGFDKLEQMKIYELHVETTVRRVARLTQLSFPDKARFNLDPI